MTSPPLQIYWFDGCDVLGPVTGAELREMAFQGAIRPDTQIQVRGRGEWVPASKLKGLFGDAGQVLPHPEETRKYLRQQQQRDAGPAQPAPRKRLTLGAAEQALADAKAEFVSLFKSPRVEIEYYRPDGVDRQSPHDRDEVYVVARGQGRFELQGRIRPFEAGEVLFVPAGAEHRFLEFTDDFAVWVVFIEHSTG